MAVYGNMPVGQIKTDAFFFSTTRLSHQTESTLVWGNESNEGHAPPKSQSQCKQTLSKTETLLEYLDLLSASFNHDLRLLCPMLECY